MTLHGGDNSLDRPLGMGVKTRERSSWRDTPLQSCAVALLGVAVLAGSFAIALRERPFRDVSPIAVAIPQSTPGGYAGQPSTDPSQFARSSSAAIQDDGAGGSSVIVIRDPSSLHYDTASAHFPDPELLEDGPYGDLPIRSADGRRPFDAYARPWPGSGGPRVAIVIGGIGVSQTGTQYAIDTLPPEVTLAFASGGRSLDDWMRAARQEGHEIIVQVPLEPFDYPAINPGENTLTVDAELQKNRDRLHWALGRITNYTGIANYMGARFTSDESAFGAVMQELGQRGLMFFDDGTSARSRAGELARLHGVPFAAADMAIDGIREHGAVTEQLDELERLARSNGYAVATGSAFDVTVDALAEWAHEARSRGIELVPLSALAHDGQGN